MLHIHCGDSSAGSLRKSGVEGEVIVWTELLMRGSLQAGLSPDEAYGARAKVLSDSTGGVKTPESCERLLRKQDAGLERFREHGEIVLWFDVCLYDQTIMIRLLEWFSRQSREGHEFSLLCVAEYPGIATFDGLGQLTPVQLRGLLGDRRPITDEQFSLAREAWAALQADTPLAIVEFLKRDSSALPYVAAAFRRFLQQFPSTENGLSRMENKALELLCAGEREVIPLFRAVSDSEHPCFVGDSSFFGCLNHLAVGKVPLVEIRGPEPCLPQWEYTDINRWRVSPTAAGREVQAGRLDAIELNSIDCWFGGTHLVPGNLWRWDEALQQICRSEV